MVRHKFRARDIALGLLAVAVVITILMFYIWHQVESIRLGYNILELESELNLLTEEISALEAQRAALLSPEHVEKIAKEKLGYTQVRDEQIREREGKTTGIDRP
jgi:cell division protein FtsL